MFGFNRYVETRPMTKKRKKRKKKKEKKERKKKEKKERKKYSVAENEFNNRYLF